MADSKASTKSRKGLVTVEVVADAKAGAMVPGLAALLAERGPILFLPALSVRSRPTPKALVQFEKRIGREAGAQGLVVAPVKAYSDRYGHPRRPTVQEAFPGALTVTPKGAKPPARDAILDAMSERFCAWRAQSQDGHLHILGDESGLDGTFGVYALVAARPGCGLPVYPFVHAVQHHGRVGPVLEALASALEAGRAGAILLEVRALPEPVPVAGETDLRQPHQVLWDLMIPLVLERELSRLKAKRVTVHVGVEQTGAIRAGSRASFVPHLQDLTRSRRSAWPEVTLGEAAVLAKGEHGWLAYADVLAYAWLNRAGLTKAADDALSRVLAHAVSVPFREDALRRVLDLLDDWAPHRAREFLGNLARGLDAEDFDDYGLFLDAAIRDAVAALTSPEWRDLCGALAQVLEDEPRRQAGARRILRELTPKLIAKLPTPRDRAGALNARLHAANQLNETRVANQLVALWERDLESSPDVPLETRHRFVAHRANHLMNRFEFPQAAKYLRKHLELDGHASAPVLGSLLQCYGFLGDHAAFDALLPQYRDTLGLASDTDLRLACYIAHAALDRGRPTEAFGALVAGAGAPPDVAAGLLFGAPELARAVRASPFFHVVLLKTAFAVTWVDGCCPADVATHVPDPDCLPSGHPGEALAFWGAYVGLLSGREPDGKRLAAALVGRVVTSHEPRDVIVVRLAAYWESLARGDLVAGGGAPRDFMAGVLERSAPSTRAWCARPAATCNGWAATHGTSAGIAPLVPLTFLNL